LAKVVISIATSLSKRKSIHMIARRIAIFAALSAVF
jgi:hypothetical protein